MTDNTTNDNATEVAGDGALWLSITDLARVKGVTRQTVWEKVSRFENQGLLTTKPGPGGTKLVNVGEYDYRVQEAGDLAKEQAAATAQANWDDPALRDAQTRKVRAEAALKAFELGERAGKLVEITHVKTVIAQVGEELRKPLDQLPLRADEINAAAVSGGAAAVRAKLRDIVFDLRTAFAEALRKLDLRGNGSSPS